MGLKTIAYGLENDITVHGLKKKPLSTFSTGTPVQNRQQSTTPLYSMVLLKQPTP